MKKKLVTLRYVHFSQKNQKLFICACEVKMYFKDTHSCRESQEFLEKYEGALGKGKGRKLYAYKVMMMKASG